MKIGAEWDSLRIVEGFGLAVLRVRPTKLYKWSDWF